MKKFLSIVLSLCCLFAITACENDLCYHSYSSKITKESTCKETGVRTYTCLNCEDSYTEEIPKTSNHLFSSETVKAPTCEETGVKKYTCIVCECSYTEEIDKVYSHCYNSQTVKELTYENDFLTETQKTTYVCIFCNHSYTEKLPVALYPVRTITYKAVIRNQIMDIPEVMFQENGEYPTKYGEGRYLHVDNLKPEYWFEYSDGSEISYEFKGWFTDSACTVAFTGNVNTTTGNITLYAKIAYNLWSPNV